VTSIKNPLWDEFARKSEKQRKLLRADKDRVIEGLFDLKELDLVFKTEPQWVLDKQHQMLQFLHAIQKAAE